MKIVTPGKIYMFKCPVCGCEFVEGKMHLDIVPGFDPVLECPTCGGDVRGVYEDDIFKRLMEEKK